MRGVFVYLVYIMNLLQVWCGNVPRDMDCEGLAEALAVYGVRPYRLKIGVRSFKAPLVFSKVVIMTPCALQSGHHSASLIRLAQSSNG